MKTKTKKLNLPKTDFPQQANSEKTEPSLNKLWKDKDVFNKRNELNSDTFVLHDGPPYANGKAHVGHYLNKMLKDVVVKYKLMSNHKVDYRPGWDCHGMPTEMMVEQKFGKLPADELREKCMEHALKYMNKQRNQFTQMGFFGDWDNPYMTMDKDYEVKQLKAFAQMYEKGYLYRDTRVVYYSPSTQTVLAEAELEYKNRKDTSAYFKFPSKDFDLMCWTTMPWTLPGNKAVCVNPDLTYVVRNGMLACESYEMDGEVTQTFKGSELEGLEYTNPLTGETNKVLTDKFVTASSGTGLVHLCPAHGDEDFKVCKRNGVEPKLLTDDKGHYLHNGMYVLGAGSKWVLKEMKKLGMTLKEEVVEHSYPHDWRSKKPVLFMLTEQFFLSVPEKKELFDEFKKVDWSKGVYKNRFGGMLASRPDDWCVSRQRKWGFPLPVFFDKNDKVVFNNEMLNHLVTLFETDGSNCWFKMSTDELLPPEYRNKGFTKCEDTMDVWLDSGLSWNTVLDGRVADLYFEGHDQHRGWFQSSFLTSMMLRGHAPYKKVLTHGFVMDQHGRKMGKSLGNVVDPKKYLDMYNADVLRLWSLSCDYTRDVNCGDTTMRLLGKSYFKLRNNFKYLLSNLYDYDHKYVPSDVCDKDLKALSKLDNYVNEMKKAYENYDFLSLSKLTLSYVSNNSREYFDSNFRDVLYEYDADSTERRHKQFVMYKMLVKLNKYLAPMLPYLCEEVYQHYNNDNKSVFFEVL